MKKSNKIMVNITAFLNIRFNNMKYAYKSIIVTLCLILAMANLPSNALALRPVSTKLLGQVYPSDKNAGRSFSPGTLATVAGGSVSPDGLEKINPFAEPQTRAVLFDFDGTLADTNMQVMNAFGKTLYWIRQAALDEPNTPMVQEAHEYLDKRPWRTAVGHIRDAIEDTLRKGAARTDLYEVTTNLARRYNIPDIDKVGDDLTFRFAKIYEAALMHEIDRNPPELFPGVRSFLEQLKRAGVPIYLATGTTQRVVETLAKRFGIYGLFDAIYGVPVDKDYPFPNGKADILNKIRDELAIRMFGEIAIPRDELDIHMPGEIAIFGDSKGDMAATKLPPITSETNFVAVGIARADGERKPLIDGGADFIIPGLQNWRSYWHALGFPALYVFDGKVALPEREDGFPYQFTFMQAVKGGLIQEVNVEPHTPEPFKSSIIEAVRKAADIKGSPTKRLSNISFDVTIQELLPVIKVAITTKDVYEFHYIIDGIVDSVSLNRDEKREIFLTIAAWSVCLPNTIKGERYCSYSFEWFADAVENYGEKNRNGQPVEVGVLGSGDGLAVFQYRNLLRIRGVGEVAYTQFEISERNIQRAKIFNPEDTYEQCDLFNLSEETKSRYRQKFDVLYLNNVLHEIFAIYGEEGIRKIFKTAFEFLRPNGKLVFRDGVYPERGQRNVLVYMDENNQGPFLHLVKHFKWLGNMSIYAGHYDNDIVVSYGSLAMFLTKLKYIKGKSQWHIRYPLEEEMQQAYCFADMHDYYRYLSEAGFTIDSARLGNEKESLDLWHRVTSYIRHFPLLGFEEYNDSPIARLRNRRIREQKAMQSRSEVDALENTKQRAGLPPSGESGLKIDAQESHSLERKIQSSA